MMIVLNQFLPLALSGLTIVHLLKKVHRPASKPAKGRDLTRHHQWDMLIAMEGPKLEDSDESSTTESRKSSKSDS